MVGMNVGVGVGVHAWRPPPTLLIPRRGTAAAKLHVADGCRSCSTVLQHGPKVSEGSGRGCAC